MAKMYVIMFTGKLSKLLYVQYFQLCKIHEFIMTDSKLLQEQ
jgi:hypothetical protein